MLQNKTFYRLVQQLEYIKISNPVIASLFLFCFFVGWDKTKSVLIWSAEDQKLHIGTERDIKSSLCHFAVCLPVCISQPFQ